MKKRIVIAAAALAIVATSAHAQDSLANVSKASADSAVAVAELTEAGVKVVAGTVALPFIAAGTAAEGAGRAVRQGGEDVWDSANAPLDVSPETVVAQAAPQVPYDTRSDDRARDTGHQDSH